jgi:hypothetical protein
VKQHGLVRIRIVNTGFLDGTENTPPIKHVWIIPSCEIQLQVLGPVLRADGGSMSVSHLLYCGHRREDHH